MRSKIHVDTILRPNILKLKNSSIKHCKEVLYPRRGGTQAGILVITISVLALCVILGLLAYHHFQPGANKADRAKEEANLTSSENLNSSENLTSKLSETKPAPVLSEEQKQLIKAEQERREAEQKEQAELERKQRIESNLKDVKSAITNRKWIVVEVLVDELSNDEYPDSELAILNEEIAQARLQEKEEIRRVEEILKSVEPLDTGKYSPEAIAKINEALEIYPNYEPSLALKRKIEAYPFSIKVPEEVATLAEAAQKLRAGDTLILSKGTYDLTGVFNKGIKIKGGGEKLTTIQCLTQKGSAIAMVGNDQEYALSDLTIKGLSYEDNAIDRYPLILINAKVTMSNVTVLNGSGHGIAVTGGSLDMSNCKVSKNAWDGVNVVGNDSSAIIKDSEIIGNYEHGVDFWQGATGTLTNVKANENIASGVVMMGAGTKVKLEQVQTIRNRHCGILVNTQAEAHLDRVFSSDNQLSGVVVQDQGTKVKCGITVSNNNLEAGFLISPAAEIENFIAATSEGNKGGNVIKAEIKSFSSELIKP